MSVRQAAPKAVLFGAIGTIAETSELQRRAFNAAFEEVGLDWYWDAETYGRLLSLPDGRVRVAAWAGLNGATVDADAVFRRKTAHLDALLSAVRLPARPGVADVIAAAGEGSVALGLVTTVPASTVERFLAVTHPPVRPDRFACRIDAADVAASKPAPDCYRLALRRLGLAASDAIAIEDSPQSAEAARAAGIPVLAFPGRYHLGMPFPGVEQVVTTLTPGALGLPARPEAALPPGRDRSRRGTAAPAGS